VDELFPGNEDRLNYWMMGEIHILSDNIVPNARRDGFEATTEWLGLQEELKPFIREHCKACHNASSSSNRPTAKVLASAKAAVDAAKTAVRNGITSTEERQEIKEKLEKENQRIERSIKRGMPKPEQQQLEGMLTSIKDVTNNLLDTNSFALNKIKSHLDRKQRKILMDVLSIVNSTLSQNSCSKSRGCIEQVKKNILQKYSITEK